MPLLNLGGTSQAVKPGKLSFFFFFYIKKIPSRVRLLLTHNSELQPLQATITQTTLNSFDKAAEVWIRPSRKGVFSRI